MRKFNRIFVHNFFLAIILSSCAPPPFPVVQPFADHENWLLVQPFTYFMGETGTPIEVPAGFVMDFASIPQAFWSIGLSPHGRYSRAALIHDFLYWTQTCTRKQSDNIFLIAMKESNVSLPTQSAVYWAVRIGGSSAWETNKEEKNIGLSRFVPKQYQRNIPSNSTWPQYRKTLTDLNTKDPEFKDNSFCHFGNNIVVPQKPKKK